jgi:glycosyltransferase involved in cell wall biosynthesis
MPVYNDERYVGAAVQSILSQTFREFEFVIVDDGSTDRTAEIVEAFRDPRIRLIRADHAGYLGALRRATAEATGVLLARMDSDDLCPPDRIAKQMKFMNEHPECLFITTSYGIITPNERYLTPRDHLTGRWHYLEPADLTLGKRLFCDAASVFERSAAQALDYDDELPIETPLWYRLLEHGKAAVLEEPLYYVRWRLGSLSRGAMSDGTRINHGVRSKYDPQHAPDPGREKKLSLKNEIRSVYFSAAAGDRKAAISTAAQVLKVHPLSPIANRLLFVALGLPPTRSATGPCNAVFVPSDGPFAP